MKVIHFSIIVAISLSLSLLFGTATIFGQQPIEKEQIIIKYNLKQYTDYGNYPQSDYRDVFNPFKAFDNQLRTETVKNSAWSQLGDSGFTVTLNNPLDKPICSAEINVYNPQNSPFLLTIGNKSIEGVLDSTLKQVSIGGNECAGNVDKIKLDVKATGKWTSISEIKLFTEKKIPPIEPPVCPPGSYYDDKLKQCVQVSNPINGTVITNSTIALNVSNSTVTVNADDSSNIVIQKIEQDKEDEEEQEEEEEDYKN